MKTIVVVAVAFAVVGCGSQMTTNKDIKNIGVKKLANVELKNEKVVIETKAEPRYSELQLIEQQLAAILNKHKDLVDDVNVVVESDRIIVTFPNKNLFESGATTLGNDAYTMMNDFAYAISSLKDRIKILAEGHTDNVPVASTNTQYSDNQELSELRAKGVSNIFFNNAFLAENLTSIGYGDTKPIAPNDTEENRAKNRRVVLNFEPVNK